MDALLISHLLFPSNQHDRKCSTLGSGIAFQRNMACWEVPGYLYIVYAVPEI